jgi:hypothetical protein
MKKNKTGDAGILSWHASDEHRAPKSSTKPSPKPSIEHKGQRPLLSQTSLVESIFRCDLRPSPTQKTVLDSLFSGPLLLKTLLINAGNKPRTPLDASMFLMRHHGELEPYLYSGNRSESVDLLKNLVVQWASHIPARVELQFPGDCSVSASSQIFLPIPRFGLVNVQNPSRLIDARRGARYEPTFAVVHSSLGYLVEIVFIRSAAGHAHARETEKETSKAEPRIQPASGRLGFSNFLEVFDNRVNQGLMDELRISRRFAKPDFAALEGRAVMGGLPSLGKRR